MLFRIAAAAAALSIQSAQASVDSIYGEDGFEIGNALSGSDAALSPREAYLRTQSVLKHFEVPAEPDATPYVKDLESAQTADAMKALLPYIDPFKQFSRFFKIETFGASSYLRAFRDRDGYESEDFTLELAKNNTGIQSVASLEQRLRVVANHGTIEKPLAGLRVALDPGHMGGKWWDDLTGKFVSDGQGHTISEGVINLQVSLLLEQELQRLGAETMITHRSLGPVSDIPYNDLPIPEFARQELRASTLLPWFQQLLGAAPVGPVLNQKFENDANVKKLFSENSRAKFYILRADLQARVEKIEAFRPDVTLIIHFDTAEPPGNPTGTNPNGVDYTKAYVAGAMDATEFPDAEALRFMTRHLLDPEAWNASRLLSRQVVGQISQQMGLKKEEPQAPNVVLLEPGVASRNLGLTRRLSAHALSYVECLFYNYPPEFNAFLKTTHPMKIDGVDYPYSDRLLGVANSLRDAVLKFVEGYRS